jgi:tetratricopeptide (TPR) repeat protein
MSSLRPVFLALFLAILFGCATKGKPPSAEQREAAIQYHEKGVAFSREGRLEEALSAFKRATKLFPDYGKAYYNMGVVYHELGEDDEAIEAYEKAIEIDPNDAAARMNLGNFFLRQGRLDKAIKELETVVRIEPTYGLAHHNLALAYYLAHMYHRAWDHLDKMETLGIPPDPALKEAVSTALHPNTEDVKGKK